MRTDAEGTQGPAGSDPALLEEQLLVGFGVDYAILIPLIRAFYNTRHEAAMASAVNGWLAETWLGTYNDHGRYYGSINVAASEVSRSVDEIRQWGAHPRMIQVRMNTFVSGMPLGAPVFHPIYAAAEEAGLPVALHIARGTGTAVLTPVGYASYFFENHAMYPMQYSAHLASFIFEGVFDRYPSLKVLFVEGGFAWSAPLVWRLDRYWEALRRQGMPVCKRRPSEYLQDNVRFTSQPIEEPTARSARLAAMERCDAERMLLFASDYPHFDFDDPAFVVRGLSAEARDRVLAQNALDFYGLPESYVRVLTGASHGG